MKRRASLLFLFACLCAFLFAGLPACTSDDDDNGGTPTGTVDGGTDGGVTGTKDGGGTKSDGGGTTSDAGGGGGTDGGTSNEGGTGGGSFTVGGLLSGLADGDTVVLQDNGGDNLTLTQNGPFTFTMSVANGGTYAVSVLSQPTTPAQTCGISSGNGTISGGSVGTVEVVCTTAAFTVGGTVSGLTGTGLALNDGTEDLVITGNGAFTFAHPLTSGTSFVVSVKTQPTNPVQTCKVAAGTGTIGQANVTSVSVNCDANKFTISGTVTGLTGTGLVLQDNGGDNLMVSSASFAFATTIASGQPYKVTVSAEPAGPSQTCSVTNGMGTVDAADVTNVTIACTTTKFTVGGTLTGLGAGDSVVLQDNGGDNLTVSANGMFTFATSVASGSPYVVTAMAPTGPVAESCLVTGGSSKVGAGNVTSVTVACTPTAFTVGGTISGLLPNQQVVLQDNNGDNLTVKANGTFTFATSVASGAAYAVTQLTPPATGTCHLFERTGTVGTGPVTTVTATCGIDYYVNATTGADANNGTSAATAWRTLTHAVSAVPSPTGGIINVAVGNYTAPAETFPIVPGANQTLLGDPAYQGKGLTGNTLVSGIGYYNPAAGELHQFSLSPVIAIPSTSTGVAIRGLDVVSTAPLTQDGVADGILVDGANATLANNTVSSGNDYMVISCNGAAVTLLDSTVEDGLASVIVLDASSAVKARRNTLTGEIAGYSVQVGYMTVAPTGSLVDLGTATDPGGNTMIPTTSGIGLVVLLGSTNVKAAGNIWRANVQGASASGSYAAGLVNGPINAGGTENYYIGTGGSIQF